MVYVYLEKHFYQTIIFLKVYSVESVFSYLSAISLIMLLMFIYFVSGMASSLLQVFLISYGKIEKKFIRVRFHGWQPISFHKIVFSSVFCYRVPRMRVNL